MASSGAAAGMAPGEIPPRDVAPHAASLPSPKAERAMRRSSTVPALPPGPCALQAPQLDGTDPASITKGARLPLDAAEPRLS